MALDPNLTTTPSESARVSAIENEIPAYRAVSGPAVLSVLFGLLGLLSFTSWFFLLFSAMALGLGILANRRIQRDPEIWTGQKMAQAGIVLGLVFGLAAVTTSLVQDFLQVRAATRFARQYVELLESGRPEEVIWYVVVPQGRENKSPDDIYKEFKTRASDPRRMEMETNGVLSLKNLIDKNKGTHVHFSKIETHGLEGLNLFATALLEIHEPATKDAPEKEQFAMLHMKGTAKQGKYHWWVEESKFPYQPSSFTPQAKPVDDGHGHAH